MFFYIKQYSTSPILKFPIDQKIMEKFNITDEMMENVAVTFSMFDIKEEQYVIANNIANISYRKDITETPYEFKYTLYYTFNSLDTNKYGNFIGEFKLTFLGDYCGTITLPNNDYINIVIMKSTTKTNIVSKDKSIIWYGSYGTEYPNDGTDIRTLSSTYKNYTTFSTGIENTVFVVAIPVNKQLVSVIDLDAMNIDLTNQYEYFQPINTVPDDRGVPLEYKVYIYSTDVPYNYSHRHKITIN